MSEGPERAGARRVSRTSGRRVRHSAAGVQRLRAARGARPREQRAAPLLVITLGLVGLSIAGSLIGPFATSGYLHASGIRPAGILATQLPASVPPGAVSSSWYCPGAGGTNGSAEGSPAGETVVLVNTTPGAVQGIVTAASSDGPTSSSFMSLAAFGSATVDPARMVPGPYVASTFDFASGGVTATEEVMSPDGTVSTQCASSTSTRWYFSDGSTANGNQMLIGLYNPLGTDAVVNLAFSTDAGPSAPPRFQSIVVQARSLVMKDVGAFVQSRTQVATSVTVLAGSVVADELQLRAAVPHAQIGLCLGAPLTASSWYFPTTVDQPGMTVGFHLFNPGASAARVEVAISLTRGSAEPFILDVPAASEVTLPASSEVRIPVATAYSTEVSVLSGPGVVVQRSLLATKPSGYSGFSDETGAPSVAQKWLLSAEPLTFLTAELVGIEAPQGAPQAAGGAVPRSSASVTGAPSALPAASVSVYQLVKGSWKPLKGLQHVAVQAGSPLVVRMNSYPRWYAGPLLISASASVVASQELYQVGVPAVTSTIGFPLIASAYTP